MRLSANFQQTLWSNNPDDSHFSKKQLVEITKYGAVCNAFRSASHYLPSFTFKYFQHPALNTLNLCPSLSVEHKISHLYETTGNIYAFK
jgi:hypothetical protein